MIIVDDIDVWANLFVHFRRNMLDSLPNDNKIWETEFLKWLRQQGADVVFSEEEPRSFLNGVGISVGYDKLKFENDNAALIFLLKWS